MALVQRRSNIRLSNSKSTRSWFVAFDRFRHGLLIRQGLFIAGRKKNLCKTARPISHRKAVGPTPGPQGTEKRISRQTNLTSCRSARRGGASPYFGLSRPKQVVAQRFERLGKPRLAIYPTEWYIASPWSYGMIVSFRDDWLRDFFVDDVRSKKIPSDLESRLFRKIQMIDDATTDQDLRVPPSNHFEKLRGDLAGFHSVRVNKQWRLIFRWDGSRGEATGVFLDNHSYL